MRDIKKILYGSVLAAVLAVGVSWITGDSVSMASSNIDNLRENREYTYDLDQDGTDETISYAFEETGDDVYEYNLTINGETVVLQDELYVAYAPGLQMTDIDTTDGVLDMWVYSYGSSDDVIYSALYEYKSGSLTQVYNLTASEINNKFCLDSGYLNKVGGDGTFSVTIDRAFNVDVLIGNHLDSVDFELKDGVVSRTETDTYDLVKIFNKSQKLTARKTLKFYTNHKKSKVKFTVKKGQKVTPLKIYNKGNQLYVLFKNSKGKKGWLNVSSFSYKNRAFKDIMLFD